MEGMELGSVTNQELSDRPGCGSGALGAKTNIFKARNDINTVVF